MWARGEHNPGRDRYQTSAGVLSCRPWRRGTACEGFGDLDACRSPCRLESRKRRGDCTQDDSVGKEQGWELERTRYATS